MDLMNNRRDKKAACFICSIIHTSFYSLTYLKFALFFFIIVRFNFFGK